ncbi:Pimeloyl-ACP methyl ester carboxylesterase [Amphritea atlantica]|uniref:Pimeloyl-ACP methyl ester carboxylesterase n=1 Tax=Amphritea atlantica TaxID=355243 RepID=A0A1H9D4U6_9GAMM|nr:alpha/beta hydrolase [Amphritea atlantica]SEQ07808.1 Pimeloyl-ACP methyl ester carboxylesterase [Amphritea atlantica]
MSAIVFLPGLICDQAVWEDQVKELLHRGFECQVIDYGNADSLTEMAYIALEQAPESFALVGHSMGGRVAMEVARQAPQRITQLVLMDTGYLPLAPGSAGEKERAGRMALIEKARQQGMRIMGQEWMQGMVLPQHLKDEPLCNAILNMIERKTVAQFEAQQTALLTRPDATDVLRSLNCPTLFICGSDDLWSPVSQHEAMSEQVADSIIEVIAHSGHMCTMEQPQAVNQALIHWLQPHPG